MSFIEVKNLNKTYSSGNIEVQAVKNVSFEIEKGEVVVIVGASGAGKTTLLNVLGGMDTPTTGNVIIVDKIYQIIKKNNLHNIEGKILDLYFNL